MAYQYDMFQEFDEHTEINAALAEQKDSIRRTQRRFFAENKQIMKLILDQNKQIESLQNRLNNLVKEKND